MFPIVSVPLLIVTVLVPKCVPVFKTVMLPAFRIVWPEKVLDLPILRLAAPSLMSVAFVPVMSPTPPMEEGLNDPLMVSA